ncbi:major facilitator superfamily domain-containing protein [Dactylonectria macrodidyma]|uniref:Major facilitator superfamily domain-containing protein n=1 Tax=Dactylonectria macrodidyma TaxID=307937 RepID=A0A9P9F631_9HYPO|nr:major facilitator superfamily domain-containing protein [Dactylonectria macrodidyma]
MNKGTDRNILTQLGVTSDQYGLVTVLYTVPYIVAEVPSNLLLKKFKPSRWQSRIMLSWGIVTACTAAVSSLGGLYTCRFLLGLTEAGMFPGIILQLSYWYRPDEIAVRLIWIFSLGNVAGIIGGLLAYGFHAVSGTGGLSGWQWLFAVEGALTVALSGLVFFTLPDFPGNTKWLSPVERAFLQARLPQNSPRNSEKNFVGREIVQNLRDKRLWLFTLSWALMTCGKNGIDFYRPTIISNMGFSDIATAQVLNIPTSALAIILILILGYSSNTAKIPLPLYPIGCTVVIITMYSILVVYPNDIGVYLGMMIGIACGTAWFPLMWPWRAQTTNGATGSAFAIGFVNSYGQVGDALGPQMFQDKYEPRYRLPFGLSMALVALCGLTNGVTWWVTRQTESDTRRHKLARLEAKKKNEAVLEDVVDHDLEPKSRAH